MKNEWVNGAGTHIWIPFWKQVCVFYWMQWAVGAACGRLFGCNVPLVLPAGEGWNLVGVLSQECHMGRVYWAASVWRRPGVRVEAVRRLCRRKRKWKRGNDHEIEKTDYNGALSGWGVRFGECGMRGAGNGAGGGWKPGRSGGRAGGGRRPGNGRSVGNGGRCGGWNSTMR